MIRHAAAPVRVRVIESALGLGALEESWEALQRDAAITSVFASFDWQKAWWDVYGRGRPLRLLVAFAGEELVGILPLYVETVQVLRRPVRLLRFVGTGGDTSPDDLGPILAASREEEVARALADAVLRVGDWDVLGLTDMHPDCAFTAAMRTAVERARLGRVAGRCERITFMALPATFDAWLASLHRDRRYRIKNARKKLYAAHPDARFFLWTDPATLDAGVDRLAHLHRKRWQSIGAPHGFSSPEYIAFHRAVITACLPRDRLRLYCLELSGQTVAMYYFYKFRDRTFLMQSGFDPDFGNVKPGTVLLGHVIEHAIGEGYRVLDFLRGDHQYKEELATGERETVYLTAFRPRAGAAIYYLRRLLLPALKTRVVTALRRRPPEEAKPT
ncbi:MAG: cellulose biosynthesis protein [Myxococcales bacterium]|nr:cellulose biosynthesis protein [Myxococcales bacterium]